MAIKNVEELRNHALKILEKLGKGGVDVGEAGTTAKLCETILGSAKTELAYCAMLQREPVIKFLETQPKSKQKRIA